MWNRDDTHFPRTAMDAIYLRVHLWFAFVGPLTANIEQFDNNVKMIKASFASDLAFTCTMYSYHPIALYLHHHQNIADCITLYTERHVDLRTTIM